MPMNEPQRQGLPFANDSMRRKKSRPHLSPSTGRRKTIRSRWQNSSLRNTRIPDELTLVVVNRVPRAQRIYERLIKGAPTEHAAVIHSRFRPSDRKAHETILHATGGRIVIATQAVEAGVVQQTQQLSKSAEGRLTQSTRAQ
jgi:CRISPR/Cas system-associated endonuclease/helicase Cas3